MQDHTRELWPIRADWRNVGSGASRSRKITCQITRDPAKITIVGVNSIR